jgi:hypothetical protein
MTIEIVFVTRLASKIAPVGDDQGIDFELHHFGNEAWNSVLFSFNVAILNQDVFTLDIAKVVQSLPERLDGRPRILEITKSCQISASWNLGRLLRLNGPARSKEHSAKTKDRDFFLHVFFSVSIHLSLDT